MNREAQLEKNAKDAGAARVRKAILRAEQEGRGAETPAGLAILRQSVEPVAMAIRHSIEDARGGKAGRRATAIKTLERLEPEVSAYLALKEAVSAAIERRPLTMSSIRIGSAIEEELRLAAYEQVEPNLYHHMLRRLKQRGAHAEHARRVFVFSANKAGIELPSLTKTEKVHVGIKLLDLVIDTTGIIKSINLRMGKKLKAIIHPTEEVHEWLKNYNSKAELLKPAFAPTVVAPKEWKSTVGGGYLTSNLVQMPLVKRCSRTQMDLLKSADLRLTYDSLNAIQATPWRINERILSVMEEAWERDVQMAMPNREDLDLPNHPMNFRADKKGMEAWEFVEPDDRKRWKIEARRIHEENATSRGRRINVAGMLTQAREMAVDEEIFFPHQLDFRGRAYAVPIRLTPQGSDHSKALLTFAQGKPIETPRAAGWLALNGANLYGFDKAALDERIAWSQEREGQIIRTAEEPFRDLWWTEADKPWSFLAWCHEYAAFAREGYGYVSALPVSVDGSCNGLQHFSAMLRDPLGGAAVNLVPSDKPSDIYQRVADRVVERLKKGRHKDREGKDIQWIVDAWLRFGIDRKITKRAVMVLPYGGTFRSCMDYVRDAVNEKFAEGKENPFGLDLGKATAFLSKLVWHSISDVVVAARAAMGWLQKIARVATRHGVPLTWATPTGFPAYQAYKKVKDRRVKTRLQGSLVYLTQRENLKGLDPDRQALGISPNFVHSLDAAAMMLTIDLARNNGVSQFAMIHDSYGTVAADMDMLSACLREAFVDMYREHNVLEEFLSGLPEEVRKDCPPVPKMGSLDIGEVRNSDFFFA